MCAFTGAVGVGAHGSGRIHTSPLQCEHALSAGRDRWSQLLIHRWKRAWWMRATAKWPTTAGPPNKTIYCRQQSSSGTA